MAMRSTPGLSASWLCDQLDSLGFQKDDAHDAIGVSAILGSAQSLERVVLALKAGGVGDKEWASVHWAGMRLLIGEAVPEACLVAVACAGETTIEKIYDLYQQAKTMKPEEQKSVITGRVKVIRL